jgi:hypothetical protein
MNAVAGPTFLSVLRVGTSDFALHFPDKARARKSFVVCEIPQAIGSPLFKELLVRSVLPPPRHSGFLQTLTGHAHHPMTSRSSVHHQKVADQAHL